MIDEEESASNPDEQTDDEMQTNGFYREIDLNTNLEDKIEMMQQYMVNEDPIFENSNMNIDELLSI
jgi:hypothetical protein